MMLRAALFGASVGVLALTASGAQAAETFDNPAMGDVPCVVVAHYEAKPVPGAGPGHFRATVTLENVCDRSMEVQLCLALKDIGDADEDRCFGGLMRPRSEVTTQIPDSKVRVADKTLQWRYAP